MQAGAVDFEFDRGRRAEPGPAPRIELLDQDLHIEGRLLGRHVAGSGGDAEHFQLGIE